MEMELYGHISNSSVTFTKYDKEPLYEFEMDSGAQTHWYPIDPSERIDIINGSPYLSTSAYFDIENLETPRTSGDEILESKSEMLIPADKTSEYFDENEWIVTDCVTGKTRHPKILEFLRLLLSNPRYKSYASWLDKDVGSFKIHKPNEVVELWKRVKIRKNDRCMNYDTFSRSLRYHYRSGLIFGTRVKYTYCFPAQ